MARTLTVRISSELMIQMLTKGNDVTSAIERLKCVRGLCEGAMITGARYDGGSIVIQLTSPGDGEELVDVWFERTDDNIADGLLDTRA